MSCEQTFDTVDTLARDRRNWPSHYDFHYPDDILKWRDISTGIFKILEQFEHGENKYGGKCLILKLESFSGPIIFVWAPGCLVLALQQDEDAKLVQNLGVKVDANGNQYFDFKLCWFYISSCLSAFICSPLFSSIISRLIGRRTFLIFHIRWLPICLKPMTGVILIEAPWTWETPFFCLPPSWVLNFFRALKNFFSWMLSVIFLFFAASRKPPLSPPTQSRYGFAPPRTVVVFWLFWWLCCVDTQQECWFCDTLFILDLISVKHATQNCFKLRRRLERFWVACVTEIRSSINRVSQNQHSYCMFLWLHFCGLAGTFFYRFLPGFNRFWTGC